MTKKEKKSNPWKIITIFSLLIIAYLLGNINYLKNINLDTKNNQENKIEDTQTAICDLKQNQILAEKCTVLIKSNKGSGSGVILDNRFIITNRHVVESGNNFKFIDYENKNLTARFWNYSKQTDLAIFKLEEEHTGCRLNLEFPEKGADVIAIGYPEEIFKTLEASVTKGTVSKIIQDENDNYLIKTDTPINPGNSGGPLINQCGIIGINTLKYYGYDERQLENVGYAISSKTINNQLNDLIENGGNIPIPQDTFYAPKFYRYYDDIPADINGFTSEDLAVLKKIKEFIKLIKGYWDQYNGSDFDQNTVAQIKDILARISNITEIIIPKALNSQKLNDNENQLVANLFNMINTFRNYEFNLKLYRDSYGYYYYQCQNKICTKTYGLSKSSCLTSYDCTPRIKYHYECKNMMCQYIEGEGENSCYSSSDCYHYVCQGKSCIKVEGKGTDECYSDYSCKHNECKDGQCIEIEGAGSSSCYSDYSCYHNECQNGKCVKINSPGTSTCYSDYGCQ